MLGDHWSGVSSISEQQKRHDIIINKEHSVTRCYCYATFQH